MMTSDQTGVHNRSDARRASTDVEAASLIGGQRDDQNAAPQNVSQRLVDALLAYQDAGDIRPLLGELVACVCDLDVALAKLEREGQPSQR